jgi:hypothetical protein
MKLKKGCLMIMKNTAFGDRGGGKVKSYSQFIVMVQSFVSVNKGIAAHLTHSSRLLFNIIKPTKKN